MKKIRMLLILLAVAFSVSGFVGFKVDGKVKAEDFEVSLTGENMAIEDVRVEGTNYRIYIKSTSENHDEPDAIRVKMGGVEMQQGGENGYAYHTYYNPPIVEIYNATGDIEIFADAVPRVYNVHAESNVGWSMDKKEAIAGEDFSAIITLEENYSYNFENENYITVAVNDQPLNDFTFDPLTGALFVKGEYINWHVHVSVDVAISDGTEVEVYAAFSLEYSLSNETAIVGEDFETTVIPLKGYILTDEIFISQGGWMLEENCYTFDSKTGKLTVFGEYIKGQTRILVLTEKVEYSVTFVGENVTAIVKPTFTAGQIADIVVLTADSKYTLPKEITVLIDGKLGVNHEDYFYFVEGNSARLSASTLGNYEVFADGYIPEHLITLVGDHVTLEGDTFAKQNFDYTARIKTEIGYIIKTVSVKIGNEDSGYFHVDHQTGEFFIYGGTITGEVVVTVTVEQGYRVDFVGKNVTLIGATAAFEGHEYSAKLTTDQNYFLPAEICIKMNGAELVEDVDYVYDTENQSIVIFSTSGDIEIYIKALHNHLGTEHTTGLYNGDKTHTYVCTVCGDEDVESCFGGIATCSSGERCEICNGEYGKINPNAHSWDSGAVTENPTCMKNGTKTFTCIHNQSHTYEEDVEIDENAHHWDEGTVTYEQSCSEEGEMTFVCIYNGEHIRKEKLDKLDHTYTNDCDKDCDVCGKERDVLVHAYTNDCDKDCDVCGEVRVAPEHKDEDKNHSCDECGEKISECEDKTADGDHNCDICSSENISSCEDEDKNGICDECRLKIKKDGLSVGAIAGIVSGSAIGLGLIGYLIFFLIKRKAV